MSQASLPGPGKASRRTPTYFFLRGLAIILPPVLTLLILLWVANGFGTYVIQPLNTVVRYVVANFNSNIRTKDQLLEPDRAVFPPLPDWRRNYLVTKILDSEARAKIRDEKIDGRVSAEWVLSEGSRDAYVPMGKGVEPIQYVPLADYDFVFKTLRPQPPPTTATGLYMEIAAVSDFKLVWQLTVLALSLTIVALYFLGHFVTARIGSWFVRKIEGVLVRVPLVRNVYSTVKQVTDFVLSDREVEFKRVVALEYPRAGSWTLGFVTGEGMLDCAAEVGEPMLTVLVATSPMPMGGFTIMVPRSGVIDLNMTVDQAVQFIVSCGVLTPEQQRTTPEALAQELLKRVERPALTARAASPRQ